jgi:hypothetical protein
LPARKSEPGAGEKTLNLAAPGCDQSQGFAGFGLKKTPKENIQR